MKSRSRAELACSMGVSSQTLRRWLKKENIELKPRLISVDDQITILKTLKMERLIIDLELHPKKNGMS